MKCEWWKSKKLWAVCIVLGLVMTFIIEALPAMAQGGPGGMTFAGENAEQQVAWWLIALSGLALASSLAALGVWALPRLRNQVQGYPLEAQIEEALLPIAFQGICAAFKLSEKAMDEIGARIHGIDKKWLANAIYDLLPDMVGKFPLVLVKRLIPRERFEQLVQDAYDRFDRDYTAFGDRYQELFEEWKADYQDEVEAHARWNRADAHVMDELQY